MRVLHVLASVSESWGGPPSAVKWLVKGLSGLGVESLVMGVGDRDFPMTDFGRAFVKSWPAAFPGKFGIPVSPGLVSALFEETRAADIVHIHEPWHMPHVVGALTARILDRPYVVSPHGALLPSSMARHEHLKRLAWYFYERAILSEASGLHALTHEEAAAITSMLDHPAVEIIPNCVDVSAISGVLSKVPEKAVETLGLPRKYVAYLGRIDARKGIDVLLDSFSLVAREHPDLCLVLAGPDPDNLWPRFSSRLSAEIARRVRYLGFVDVGLKYCILSEALFFVLPSISEGLSMSILESLACGTPVLASPGGNMREVEDADAGRVVPRESTALADALTRLLRDDSQVQRMRGNALRLAEERYSMESVACQMLSLYEEMTRTASVQEK